MIRIYKGLVTDEGSKPESSFAFYLEDASLVTFAWLMKASAASRAALTIRCCGESEFSEEPIRTTMKAHEHRARLLLELEEKVAEVIAKLKERGLESPYLRSFVVARINPLRWISWIKGDLPDPEKVLQTMRERAARFKTGKVKQQDLFGAFGAVGEQE